MRSKKRARLVSERDLKIDVVTVSQLAPKDVLSPKQRSIRPKARIDVDLVRLPFEEIRRCRQTSSFVTKRLLSKSCRQSLRALLVWPVEGEGERSRSRGRDESYLVDPASSHMLVSKIKPCMSKYKLLYCETANGSLNQLSSI